MCTLPWAPGPSLPCSASPSPSSPLAPRHCAAVHRSHLPLRQNGVHRHQERGGGAHRVAQVRKDPAKALLLGVLQGGASSRAGAGSCRSASEEAAARQQGGRPAEAVAGQPSSGRIASAASRWLRRRRAAPAAAAGAAAEACHALHDAAAEPPPCSLERSLHNLLLQEFKIQNMVGSCDVKFPIRLEGLASTHAMFCSVSCGGAARARGAEGSRQAAYPQATV